MMAKNTPLPRYSFKKVGPTGTWPKCFEPDILRVTTKETVVDGAAESHDPENRLNAGYRGMYILEFFNGDFSFRGRK